MGLGVCLLWGMVHAAQPARTHAVTRELKLALIVGFLLVLLVSVLIADHLSGARKAELSTNITPNPAIAPIIAPAPQEPLVTIEQGKGGAIKFADAGTTPGGQAVLDGTMTTIADRTGEPIAPPMVSFTRVGDLTISQTPTPDQTLGTDTLRGNQQPSPDATPIDKQIDKAKVANGTNGLEVKPFGGGETIRVASKDIVLPEPKPAPGQPKTETTDEKWYTVAAGDSAFKIAKKFYGKGEYWKQLQAYNGNRIGTDGSVRVGVRVKVPEAAKLGIKDAPVVKADEKVATKTLNKPEAKAAEGPKADPKPETSGRSYTVKKGDTLGQIAQRELGTMKRADEIVKLNKLKSASSIREGMKLSLPTK